MKFEGYLYRSVEEKKYWIVEIPVIGIHTQARSKIDCYLMAKDAIETVVGRSGFSVTVEPGDENTFLISANKTEFLIGLLLRHQRALRGLTLMEVARKLKSKSPNAYGRYEQGRVLPSVEKLTELLKAVDQNLEPVLKLSRLAG